jgi:hypothetical protein
MIAIWLVTLQGMWKNLGPCMSYSHYMLPDISCIIHLRSNKVYRKRAEQAASKKYLKSKLIITYAKEEAV